MYGRIRQSYVGSAAVVLVFSIWWAAGPLTPSTAATTRAGKPYPDTCYAFLRDGNLYLACNGKRVQLTSRGDLDQFAVDASGSQLVVLRQEVPRPDRITYFLNYPSKSPRVDYGASKVYALLFPTCGTIVSRYWGQAEDVKTGEKLSFPPYEEFLCSSDRKTIIGTMKGSDDLMVGLPPRQRIGSVESNLFGISASGKTIAYCDDKGKLCITQKGGLRSYIPKVWPYGRLAVDDGPRALFESGTGDADGCYYKNSNHGSRRPKPGYTLADQCYALFLYHGKGGRIEKLGYFEEDPQWVTPNAAAALKAWAARTRPLP